MAKRPIRKIACVGEVMIELIADASGSAQLGVAGDTYNTAVYLNRAMREHRTRGAFFFSRARFTLSFSLSLSLSLSLRVCSVLRWRRSVLSFFSRKPTTLKNQKNQSRNTNALVTKINQRRRLSLRLFVHDDIDAFPSR